jgi:putative transposase
VGIDAGLTSLLTLSTGEKIANPRHEKADRARLGRVQRNLSRKATGWANRTKARLNVAQMHALVDRRKDFLHKLTTRLVRENQAIRAAGLAVLACGGGVRPKRGNAGGQLPVNQEPRGASPGIPVLQGG